MQYEFLQHCWYSPPTSAEVKKMWIYVLKLLEVLQIVLTLFKELQWLKVIKSFKNYINYVCQVLNFQIYDSNFV
jgi:hypothetical protein